MTQVDVFQVTIVPKKSIRICRRDRGTDVTFTVGDTAEYDSYNLSYLGTITQITEKTVTIKPKYSERTRRLKIDEFCWRNYDFNLEEVIKRNNETSMYI